MTHNASGSFAVRGGVALLPSFAFIVGAARDPTFEAPPFRFFAILVTVLQLFLSLHQSSMFFVLLIWFVVSLTKDIL
jgi:hypothetical protein